MSGKSFALDYHYNTAGVRDWLQYPDGDKVTFSPNAFGEATQAVRQARTGRALLSYASNATYYPTGTINTFNYGNGLTHKTTLNIRKVPGSIKDSKTGLTALHYSYSYDNNLNVTSVSDNVSSAYSLTDLTYDGLDRLRTTTGNSGIGSSSLTYDGLGNIKTYSSKGRSLVYNYNTTDNRLTSVTGIAGKYSAFAYDDRGNIYGNGSKTFTYNRANQLISSGTNSYLYDGHNGRVKQTDSKGTSYSLYSQDGTLLYRETADGGINYIYLGKKLIAKDGVIPENAGKQHYRPFGSSIEGEIDDAGYTGHKFDTDLGLSYMQARYYDPIIGRIYSNDPADMMEHIERNNTVHGFNRYTYANNNPYKYTDPNGEFVAVLFTPPVLTALGKAAVFVGSAAAAAWAGSEAINAYNESAGDKNPSTPTGSRDNPMDVEPGTNESTEIGDREYSGHALDRMQGRGIPPSAVEESIQNGQQGEGNTPGTTTHTDSTNGVKTVTNQDGKVVTVITVERDK